MHLETYQDDAVRVVLHDLMRNRNGLLVAPTGAGKTVMMAVMLRALFDMTGARRALVLQHTVTLWDQNTRELSGMLGGFGFSLGVVGAGRAKNLASAHITLATAQALGRTGGGESWLDHLKPFDIVVVDEAHHVAAPDYAALLARLTAMNPNVYVLGLTATPQRADGKGLGQFDRISHQVGLGEVIASGRIVPPRVLSADLDSIEPPGFDAWTDGEDASWSATMRKQVVLDEVVRQHLALWEERPGVYFCADVAHAEALADAFAASGLRTASVNHTMRHRAVQATLGALGAGELDVVTNPAMLTEGFNCPRVALIGLTRGFASKPLLIQAIGRGLRAAPGKQDGLVLDFVQAVPRHGDIFPGLDIFGRSGRRAGAAAGGTIAPRPVLEVSAVVMREVDALGGLLDHVQLGDPSASGRLAGGESEAQDGELIARCRKEAQALGLTTYFTSKPCKRGHVAERYASGSGCVECSCENTMRRRQKPEVKAKAAESNRRWRQDPSNNERQRMLRQDPANKIKAAARSRKSYQANKMKFTERYQANKTKIAEANQIPANKARKAEQDRLRRQDPANKAKQAEQDRLRYQRKKQAAAAVIVPPAS